MARDRPSPYGEEGVFFIVARGPVPRDRSMARETLSDARMASEGPRPTMKGGLSAAALLHRDQEVSPTGRKKSRLFNAQYVKLSHHNTTTEPTLCP